jgi:two-component system KDP operon response regulator KdpE
MPLVLVIDDDRVIRRVLEINLRADGFDVAEAASGAEALAAATERRPDVVILDLGLPDVDGAELIPALRADVDAAPLAIVVMTGADPDARSGDRYASTVEAVLRKPVDPVDLLGTVRRVLPRGA